MEHLGEVIPLFPGIRIRPEGPTFKDLADLWLKSRGSKMACPQNVIRHVNHLERLWDLTEGELRPRAIAKALAELMETLGPSTVNKVRGTGRQIIKDAILNEDWSGTNPFDVIDRLQETKAIHRNISLEEARALLPHLAMYRRREALFMLYLGPRPGEMRGLKKADVDFARGTILIRRSNGRNRTKTGKEREVPIPDGLWPYLEDAVRSSACEYVFPERGGDHAQRADSKLARVLREPLRKAGLVTGYRLSCRRKGCGYSDERPTAEKPPCPKCGFRLLPVGLPIKVRFYDLRHSAATLHTQAGANPLAVQMALGHAPESLTQSLYTHLTVEDVRRELNKLQI